MRGVSAAKRNPGWMASRSRSRTTSMSRGCRPLGAAARLRASSRQTTNCRSHGCVAPARSSSARPTCRNSPLRQRALRRDPQPLERQSHAGRLDGRGRCERGGGLCPGRHRHRWRRLDPPPGQPYRTRRIQALDRAVAPDRRLSRDIDRLRDRRNADPHGRRRPSARRHHEGSRPAGSPLAVRIRAALAEQTPVHPPCRPVRLGPCRSRGGRAYRRTREPASSGRP